MMKTRKGFTLPELLIVVAILLMLASFALAVFNRGSGEKIRSGARVAQSAFLGAKDRAMHAKAMRGVRLVRDELNPQLVTGFAYVQPLEYATADHFTIPRPNYPTDLEAPQIVLSVSDSKLFADQDTKGLWPPSMLWVRIPAKSGPWYQVNATSATAPYYGGLNANKQMTLNFATYLQADKQGNPYNHSTFTGGKQPNTVGSNAIDHTDADSTVEIMLGNELLPFHQPIALPAGVVIDLRYSSPAAQLLATQGTDLMFSPRGSIPGPAGGMGFLSFALRDLADALQGYDPSDNRCAGQCLILTINPSTGLVSTFEADLTDANQDGIVDNLFSFSQQGRSAGR